LEPRMGHRIEPDADRGPRIEHMAAIHEEAQP
jgi:hypothetical protein